MTTLIGILSSIALPSFMRWIDRSRNAQAITQMSCMAKEAWAYKMETGTFPPDTLSNVRPNGISCFLLTSSGRVPFNSRYDYENWSATGGRYIQITFFGKNGVRDSPVNTAVYPTPGLYEDDDDVILSLGIQ